MNQHDEPIMSRRGFLTKLVAIAGGALLGVKAFAQQVVRPGWAFTGDPLTTHVRVGEPPVQPLDTMLLFERGDDNNDRAMTHEVLSLIHEEKGRNSYPWTIYASL